jgi:hypothetical protein
MILTVRKTPEGLLLGLSLAALTMLYFPAWAETFPPPNNIRPGVPGKRIDVTFDLLVPADIKSSGAHGTVVLEGDIGPDAYGANVIVTQSSKSDAIDQFALNRYSHVSIGKDVLESGANRFQLTVHVFNTRGMDFGANYSCQQAILDNDWYKQTFGTPDNEHTQLYLLIEAGGNIMGRPELAFAKDHKRYDRVWSAAITTCRQDSEARFLDTIIKEGTNTP